MVGKPAEVWAGVVVAVYFAWWQETHVVGLPTYTLSAWHEEHATVRCAPVSGNGAFAWLNAAPSHVVVVWQVWHVVGKPADVCAGVVVAEYVA